MIKTSWCSSSANSEIVSRVIRNLKLPVYYSRKFPLVWGHMIESKILSSSHGPESKYVQSQLRYTALTHQNLRRLVPSSIQHARKADFGSRAIRSLHYISEHCIASACLVLLTYGSFYRRCKQATPSSVFDTFRHQYRIGIGDSKRSCLQHHFFYLVITQFC